MYCVLCNIIFTNTKTYNTIINSNNYISKVPIKDNDIIATISIPKIQIEKAIYKSDSDKNNVDKNVMLLNGSTLPDKENSIIFLAAHSGDGNNAYFNNLKELKENDEVYFEYKNKKYTYKVIKKREIQKNGFITGTRYEQKELVLTTCSDNKDKQLIVNCVLIKEDG